MKETYYTKNSIEKQSKIFQKKTASYYKERQLNIKPDKAALLVLDMQGFFLNPLSHAYIPSAQAIIPKIINVSNAILNSGSDIIFTRHINTIENSNNMNTWWRDILTESDKLSELSEQVYIKDSPIIIKSQYDAFYNTKLEEILKNSGKTQLIISGVMTHLCCETTARSAFVRGFEVFFGIDMTATYNKQFHISTLLNLSHGFASPLLSDDIIKNLNENN